MSNETLAAVLGSVLLVGLLSMPWWWPRLERKIRDLV
jgi:hypothetical protein